MEADRGRGFCAWHHASAMEASAKEEKRKRRNPRHDWESVGADDCIFFWLEYYGTKPSLPPHPEEGNRADLERAVKEIFERNGCGRPLPGETTIHDYIQKCIRKYEGRFNRPQTDL